MINILTFHLYSEDVQKLLNLLIYFFSIFIIQTFKRVEKRKYKIQNTDLFNCFAKTNFWFFVRLILHIGVRSRDYLQR